MSGAADLFSFGRHALSEKQAIERGTAEGFLVLYNQFLRTDFKIVEMSDAPDARCKDSHGNMLNLEITTTKTVRGISKLS